MFRIGLVDWWKGLSKTDRYGWLWLWGFMGMLVVFFFVQRSFQS
jgi:hypothetical protein